MMKTKIKFLLLIISIAFNLVLAQDKTEYTLTYNSLVSSPKATLNDVAWIAGYWRGKAFDGMTFEKVSDNEMNVYVRIKRTDNVSEEMKFNYHK